MDIVSMDLVWSLSVGSSDFLYSAWWGYTPKLSSQPNLISLTGTHLEKIGVKRQNETSSLSNIRNYTTKI